MKTLRSSGQEVLWSCMEMPLYVSFSLPFIWCLVEEQKLMDREHPPSSPYYDYLQKVLKSPDQPSGHSSVPQKISLRTRKKSLIGSRMGILKSVTSNFEQNRANVQFTIGKEYPFTAEGVSQSQIDISSRGTVGKLLIKVSE
jgi:hypothetical protein